MNIWWPIFTRKSKLLHLGGSPHSYLGSWWFCCVPSVLKHIFHRSCSTFQLVLCSYEQEGALYRTANRRFMTPCATVATLCTAKLNHAQCGIAIISRVIHWSATKCAGDLSFCASMWKSHFRTELCYRVKFKLQHSERCRKDCFQTRPEQFNKVSTLVSNEE